LDYQLNIAGLVRALPLCKLNEDLMIAGFVIFGDTELTTACAKALLEKAPEYDYLLTAESKGIPLIHEMARLNGDKYYILARKSPKLYMKDIFEVDVDSITTENSQRLILDGKDAVRMRDKRILLIDDVVSTGSSLTALEKLTQKAGGIVCGRMAILAEGDAQVRDDIIYLEKLPLFTSEGKEI
jgi:adenine phosphoribosyltransferase